jgi:hypothetical protein
LDSHQLDETVAWSSNVDCSCAFHQGHVLETLANLKVKDAAPCACCRQDFIGLSLPPEADENEATTSNHSKEWNAVVADATPDMASEEDA